MIWSRQPVDALVSQSSGGCKEIHEGYFAGREGGLPPFPGN